MTTMHDNDCHEDDDDDNDGDDDDHDIYGHDHDISLTRLTAGWSSAHTYDWVIGARGLLSVPRRVYSPCTDCTAIPTGPT